MAAAGVQVTPYADVNAVLGVLLAGVRRTLGGRFAGLYLHGSLALGDFDPPSSDIDFLVVTTTPLPDAVVEELAAMHAEIAAGGSAWAKKLEGSYVPRRALRRYDPDDARYPSIGVDRAFGVEQHGGDWVIQLHIMREHGLAVEGPPPRALIDPIGPDELRRAEAATLREWWSQQLGDPAWLHARAYRAYAVLTMCRARYTLEHSAVVSKPAAARWALEALDGRWPALIEQALAWRHETGPEDGPAHLDETLNFIRATLEYGRQCELSG